MKEREKEIFANRGITLVALIITIIVLLILAGVSLSFVFNGGIIDKTQQSVNEYQNKATNESEILGYIDNYLNNKINEIGGGMDVPEGPDDTDVPAVDGNGLATENTTIVAKDDPSIQIVIPEGFAPVILQTDRTYSMPGDDGAVKEIMPKEDWNSITKEQINKGIVVVDHAITYTDSVPDFNEYVWVPIVNSSKFARVKWNGAYFDGRTWIAGTHPLADVSTSGAYWEETSSEEYTNMISSVRRNKGFYISRYEASPKDDSTAQSKRGQNPWVNVSQTTAKTASSNMKESLKSHLIYGIEWDSVLQWALDSQAIIGSASGETKVITEYDIQIDSSSWGNYDNSTGGAATNSGDSVEVGGRNEYWKVNNIYDLAGNVWEWTQEKYSTATVCAFRGGYYNFYGDAGPAVTRTHDIESYTSDVCRVQGRLLCVALYSGSEN